MDIVYPVWEASFDRDVAIEVRTDGLTREPDRLARSEREAKVLASLNHPTSPRFMGSSTEAPDPRA